MSTRVLVTGGAGFIGSHLVDRLVAEGFEVTVLDDLSTGSLANLEDSRGDRLRMVEGSILDPKAVERAIDGCGVVYHLAVQCVRRSLGRPLENHEVNATGTLNVLEAARRSGRVERFVYCSSSEVYGNASSALLSETTTICAPVTVYGAAKLAGELYTQAYRQTYGLATTIVRPFNAYGPRAPDSGDRAEVIPRFAIRALCGVEPVIFGDGANGRDFTHVADLARGLQLAGFRPECEGRTVNIAFGRMITIREVAEAVLRASGRNDLSVRHHDPRPGDVFQLHADTSLARRLMGYEAEIPFERGLKEYLDWFAATCPDPRSLLEATVENWQMPKSPS